VQTCSLCNTQSPDTAVICPTCHAILSESSTTAVAYQKFKNNPRVSAVRITVAEDACPACQQMRGNYTKEELPILPSPGCSHEHGCLCFYEPVLDEIYP
jgi:hypothetical protein